MRGFLGLDLGTTHCKSCLFSIDGALLRRAVRPTPAGLDVDGRYYHDPAALWQAAASAIREVVTAEPHVHIEVIGVASMAEAGLLIDRATGMTRTAILPWYDARSEAEAEAIAREDEPLALFRRSGLHPSYKYGLAKVLWLRARDPGITTGAVWLSVADYAVFRLTGVMVTDPTLAARTYAFAVGEGRWDDAWIRHFDLDPALFPTVLPSGTPAGTVTREAADSTGLESGIPVAVSGHDHICALPAAGITAPGPVLDSIGTAESLLGVTGRYEAGERELQSSLTLVPHVLPGCFCWLGGLSSAGGSIEWLRAQLADEPLSYDAVARLAEETNAGPTGILYFPYLQGSGAPCRDQSVRAAFIGLSASHRRGDLVRAVLEGTAYEVESIRRAAECLTGRDVAELIVVGGGARNAAWVQIRADISGCTCRVPDLPEATALGAGLIAALGAGIFTTVEEITTAARRRRDEGRVVLPDEDRHHAYRHLYETGYLAFQAPLRQWASRNEG